MKTVLVVEDSVDLRSILTLALESEGYCVEVASNGAEALELLRRDPLPGMILLDLMMPVMNGWEFLEAQRVDPRLSLVPTIVCSATRPENLQSSGFLKKPVDFSDLIVTVSRFCSTQASSAIPSDEAPI